MQTVRPGSPVAMSALFFPRNCLDIIITGPICSQDWLAGCNGSSLSWTSCQSTLASAQPDCTFTASCNSNVKLKQKLQFSSACTIIDPSWDQSWWCWLFLITCRPLYVCDATAQVCPGLPASLCVRRNFMLHTDLAWWVGRSLCVAVTPVLLYSTLHYVLQSSHIRHLTYIHHHHHHHHHHHNHHQHHHHHHHHHQHHDIQYYKLFHSERVIFVCLLIRMSGVTWWTVLRREVVTRRNVMTEAVRAQEAVLVTRRWERVGLLVNDQYSTTKFDTL